MPDSINFKYKHKELILSVKRLAIIESIMTTNIKYYENFEDPIKAKDYCKEKDIETLPSKNGISLYKLKGDEFTNIHLENDNKLKVTDYLFDTELMDSFTNEFPIKYIFDNKELVGIMHFSDYNRTASYVHLYNLVTELENNIRKIFEKLNISEDEIIRYLDKEQLKDGDKLEKRKRKESYRQYPYQIFDFSDIVYYYNHLVKNSTIDNERIINKLIDFRNQIMHYKLLIKLKNYETGSVDFDLESFQEFKDNVAELFHTLEITNKELSD